MDGPVSNRRFSRRTVRQAMIIAGLAVAILLAAGGGWYAMQRAQESAAAANLERAGGEANTLASALSTPIAAIGDRLRALGQEPDVIALFEAGDVDALAVRAEELKDRFDGAIKLRLLKPKSSLISCPIEPNSWMMAWIIPEAAWPASTFLLRSFAYPRMVPI